MAGQKYINTVNRVTETGVRFVVWPVQMRGKHHEWDGVGRLNVESGAASMTIDLSPEQMRELAAVLVAQSWETTDR